MNFFEIIPQAILNNIVLLGVLWLLFQLLIAIIPLKANHKFYISTGMQFFATISFIFNLFSPDAFNYSFNNSFSIISLASLPSNTVLSYLGLFYFTALLLLIFKILIQLSKLNTIKASSDFKDADKWKNLIPDFPLLDLSKVKIGTSHLVQSPMVFGFLEPIILLPISICNHLTIEEIKLILVHELAHIVRNDFLLNIFTEIAKTILWFNPFAYLINNEIQIQREIACDEFVINYTNAPIAYSKALYQLANQVKAHQFNFSLGAIQSSNELLYRIQILNKIKPRFNKLKLIPVFFSMVLLGSILITNKQIHSPKTLAINYAASYKKSNSKSITSSTKVAFVKHSKRLQVVSKVNIIQERPINNNEEVNYAALLKETKQWIKAHESVAQFANYNEANDSIENEIAERLLMGSIIKSYQLKKAILAQRLAHATDPNEAADYLLNSKEWSEMVQYEKWTREFLHGHQ